MDIVNRIFTLADIRFPEQKAFANALGLPPSVISAWRGKKSASYNKRLPRIAEVLGTSVDYLLTGEKKEPAIVSDDRLSEEFIRLYRHLTPEQKELVVAAMRGMTTTGG